MHGRIEILEAWFKCLPFLTAALLAGCFSEMKTKSVSPQSERTAATNSSAPAFSKVTVNNFGPLTDTNILPILLTATLVDPADTDLRWSCRIPDVQGCFIDFNMGDKRMFEVLGIVFANVTTFRHRNLMPNTRFGYRIRPFFGKPSNVVSITTGKASDGESQSDDVGLGMAPPSERGTNSLRNLLTMDKAAPSELTATQVSPRVVDLKWKDNAKDADGYLVEYSFGSATNWDVAGLFRPHATSFRLAMLPADTECHFRVRAFCEGSPSLAVDLITEHKP